MDADGFRYVWRGSKLRPDRLGQRCKVVEWARQGFEVIVEFEDGERLTAPRAAIRLHATNPPTGSA